MRRWIPTRGSVFLSLRGRNLSRSRCFSIAVNDVERVSFSNGSSGIVTIDLHNTAKVSSPDPLLIYLPPFSTAFSDRPAELPRFIQRRPTAVINYRWAGYPPSKDTATRSSDSTTESAEDEDEWSHLAWPAPIHDTTRAYDWILDNLSPSDDRRRDIYVYGSYLGASLATSLTLTETHPYATMGIRGCVAYNGIYDWTTFLPDHPIYQRRKVHELDRIFGPLTEGPEFQDLERHAEALFERPGNFFDPFASPCLFYHTPGLFVPPNFKSSALLPKGLQPEDLALLPRDAPEFYMPRKSPKESPLSFPPDRLTSTILEALLLHSAPPPLPPLPPSSSRRQLRRKQKVRNNFQTQAEDLARWMRRRVDKEELGERIIGDDGSDSWDIEAAKRIQLQVVGLSNGDFELGSKGEELAAAWLDDHMGIL
ncbi:uncharacterized protein F4807DRAFT_419733 [Annulohypoxylon truncatum]|uniref:uncharacterized protein n=1 Tax=Annulohypoxylon truncatum TaxID=327061 RepID=UPI002008E0AD|nr:uncharacterized protein F4807DRAFT_419733 [Annulohypoxylon truncatum]KAI1211291.1 hypothetical protein F4807DRAFT_419733 [Annulohypoxylon truncatum]